MRVVIIKLCCGIAFTYALARELTEVHVGVGDGAIIDWGDATEGRRRRGARALYFARGKAAVYRRTIIIASGNAACGGACCGDVACVKAVADSGIYTGIAVIPGYAANGGIAADICGVYAVCQLAVILSCYTAVIAAGA